MAAVGAASYDLVLMDVQMPEMDGLEATRRDLAAATATAARAIVALTADAMQDDRERCLAAGMDDYLTKPIRPAELAEALERAQPRAPGPEAAALEPGALDRLLETTAATRSSSSCYSTHSRRRRPPCSTSCGARSALRTARQSAAPRTR